MKRATLALLTCLFFASICPAQQNITDTPASKEDVERYLEAMHTREMMKNLMGVYKKQMHQMAHEQVEKQPNLPSDFEASIDKMMDDMLRDFPFEEMLQAMIPVYQKHFTKGDFDALIAFYSSPAGQKYLKEIPSVMAEAMQASSGIMQKMMSKAMQRVQDEIALAQKENGGSFKKQSPPPH